MLASSDRRNQINCNILSLPRTSAAGGNKANVFYIALDTLSPNHCMLDVKQWIGLMTCFHSFGIQMLMKQIRESPRLKNYQTAIQETWKHMQFVEETWCRPVKTLFGIGQVTSLQFLKRIYAKRLQNASHNMYHFKNFCLHIYPTWLPKQNVVSAN